MSGRAPRFARDWSEPYGLEPRPNYRPTEEEKEDFIEMVNELGLIAAHIGSTLSCEVTFGPPRKRAKVKP